MGDLDSKHRVSRFKTRLGLGTKLGLGLGIVEVSCKVSDSESRLENSDLENSVTGHHCTMYLIWVASPSTVNRGKVNVVKMFDQT